MQKAFALLMAAFVLLLAVIIPVHAQADEHISGPEQGLRQDASSFQDASLYTKVPYLSLMPEPFPKPAVFFFALPRLWDVLLELLAPQIREYRAVFLQFFLQKINFVFVSTQAP